MNLPTKPVAQEYHIISSVEPGYRTDAPTLIKCSSGIYVSTFPIVCSNYSESQNSNAGKTVVMASSDLNAWKQIAVIDGEFGTIFELRGALYLLGVEAGRGSLIISASSDAGSTWTKPTVIVPGRFWNTSTAKVFRNGKIYWPVGMPNADYPMSAMHHQGFNISGSRIAVLCGDLSKNLLDRDAWKMSNSIVFPGIPDDLRCGTHDSPTGKAADHWLESHAVCIDGNVYIYSRIRIDNQATTGLAGLSILKTENDEYTLSFIRYTNLPGSQNHFHILYDDITGMYLLFSNLPTMREYKGNRLVSSKNGGDRRIMFMHASYDAYNWLPVCYVTIWKKLTQSCNYCTPIIDGDNIVLAARTSYKAPNQHDNDLVTLHVIPDFRSLLAPLQPDFSTYE